MANTYTALSIDEYLRERLMPVEGAIPYVQGIEMYGNSIPAGAVGGDLFEYINFQQRYDLEARIQRALKRSKEYLEKLPEGMAPRNATSWSAQMYTAFVGVDHSWPGWNALRPFPRYYLSLERLFPSPSFESAEFNRCAISLPPADRARNHILHILPKLQLHRPTRDADMVYSSRARPTPCAPTYSRLFVKIILCI